MSAAAAAAPRLFATRLGRSLAALPPASWAAAVLLLLFAAMALTGPLWVPFDPIEIGTGDPFEPPSLVHLLGTDNFGRDVLSRVVAGSRPALLTGLAATALAVAAGTAGGLLLALRRGWIDELGTRALDVLMSIPPLVLALLVISALGSDAAFVVGTVAFLFAPRVARVVRAATLAVVMEDYITAAVMRGESSLAIAWRELLPNVAGTVFVEFSIRTAYAIVFIGALGFLGFGAAPPAPDWGLMINEGYANINASFWPVIAPAGAMAVLVIAINLFTEGVARVLGQTGARGGRD